MLSLFSLLLITDFIISARDLDSARSGFYWEISGLDGFNLGFDEYSYFFDEANYFLDEANSAFNFLFTLS